MPEPKRILILGGGFAGVYTAIRLERLFRRQPEIEVALVNRENDFVFQSMLPGQRLRTATPDSAVLALP